MDLTIYSNKSLNMDINIVITLCIPPVLIEIITCETSLMP